MLTLPPPLKRIENGELAIPITSHVKPSRVPSYGLPTSYHRRDDTPSELNAMILSTAAAWAEEATRDQGR